MFDESPERLIEEASEKSEQGKTDEARKLFLRAVEVAAASGNHQTHIETLLATGAWLTDQGEPIEAMRNARTAWKLASEWGDADSRASSARLLGWVEHIMSHTDRAIEWLNKARNLAREAGDRSSEAAALGNLAMVHAHTGNLDAANDIYKKML
ncbi:MAG: tetratricopeptide repeat protein, partial [Planctomycetota bacterium]